MASVPEHGKEGRARTSVSLSPIECEVLLSALAAGRMSLVDADILRDIQIRALDRAIGKIIAAEARLAASSPDHG